MAGPLPYVPHPWDALPRPVFTPDEPKRPLTDLIDELRSELLDAEDNASAAVEAARDAEHEVDRLRERLDELEERVPKPGPVPEGWGTR